MSKSKSAPELTPERVKELLEEGRKLREQFEKRIAPMKVPDAKYHMSLSLL